MMRLGDSIQAHRTVQNLKLNAEAKLVRGRPGPRRPLRASPGAGQ